MKKLIALVPVSYTHLSSPSTLNLADMHELPIDVRLGVPAEITVSVFDEEGSLVRRLASSQLTRPTPGGITRLYWDGRDAQGVQVAEGPYTLAAETLVGSVRHKATTGVTVTSR